MGYNWSDILIKASFDVITGLLIIFGMGAAFDQVELTHVNLLIVLVVGYGHYGLGALYSWFIAKYKVNVSWVVIPWVLFVFAAVYGSIVLSLGFLNLLYQTLAFVVFSYIWTRANHYHLQGAYFPDVKRYIIIVMVLVTSLIFLPNVQGTTIGGLLLAWPYPLFILLGLLYLSHTNIYEIFMKSSLNHNNKKRSIRQFKGLSFVGGLGFIFLIECFIQFKRPFEMLMAVVLQIKSIVDYVILQVAFWAMALLVWLYGDKREYPTYKPPKVAEGNLAEPKIADPAALPTHDGSEFGTYIAIFMVLTIFAIFLILLWRRQNGPVVMGQEDDVTEEKAFVFNVRDLTKGLKKGFSGLFNREREDLTHVHPVRLKYRGWERYFRKLGRGRLKGQTPSQFALTMGYQGKEQEDFQALTHLYENIRYGEVPLSPLQEADFNEIDSK